MKTPAGFVCPKCHRPGGHIQLKEKHYRKALKRTRTVKTYVSRYWVVRHGKSGRDGECQLGPEAKVNITKLIGGRRR